jgi:HD superfamily phosphohydrolase YqeK
VITGNDFIENGKINREMTETDDKQEHSEPQGTSREFGVLHERVVNMLKQSPIMEDPTHSEQVREFILRIKPDASEELQIAGLAHDIERAVDPRILQVEGESYEEYKQRHAERSAQITAQMMREIGYEEDAVGRVSAIIGIHEIGGGEEGDTLRDADSLSYFSNNIEPYIRRNGVQKARMKVKLMYQRMGEKAKQMVKSMEFSDEARKVVDSVVEEPFV